MGKYEVVFESLNIDFVKITKTLVYEYLELVNDPLIQKKIFTEMHVYTYEKELEWIENVLNDNEATFSMIERNSGNFIGNISFKDVKMGSAEMGISIRPSYQNKRYGSEAIERLISYGFNELNLDEIRLVVFSNNLRAIHCYEKFGFTVYKIDKNVCEIDGESVDDLYMNLKRR